MQLQQQPQQHHQQQLNHYQQHLQQQQQQQQQRHQQQQQQKQQRQRHQQQQGPQHLQLYQHRQVFQMLQEITKVFIQLAIYSLLILLKFTSFVVSTLRVLITLTFLAIQYLIAIIIELVDWIDILQEILPYL